MPKIIENLEQKLIEEAQKQVAQSGYGAFTIRSVAKACGVGIGTVYNYFQSKDDLLAAFLLDDWQKCMSAIVSASEQSASPEQVVHSMFDQLLSYAKRHEAIFRDETAVTNFAGSFSHYHGLLRAQLAEPIRKYCGSDFQAEFVAESLLTWSMSGKSFDEIYEILKKLF